MNKMLGIAVGAAALVLAACGSSSDDSAPAPTPPASTSDVPSSAQTSAAGLATYVGQQIDASSDTGEPVVIGDAVLPVDDTTETSL